MYFTSVEFGHGRFLCLQSPGSFNFLEFVELIMSIFTFNAEVEQIISLDKQTWTDCKRPQNIDYVKFELQIKAQMKVNFSYACKVLWIGLKIYWKRIKTGHKYYFQ